MKEVMKEVMKERYANFFDFFDFAVHFIICPILRRYPASPRRPQITRIHTAVNGNINRVLCKTEPII
jgi:hypothetical protein